MNKVEFLSLRSGDTIQSPTGLERIILRVSRWWDQHGKKTGAILSARPGDPRSMITFGYCGVRNYSISRRRNKGLTK